MGFDKYVNPNKSVIKKNLLNNRSSLLDIDTFINNKMNRYFIT